MNEAIECQVCKRKFANISMARLHFKLYHLKYDPRKEAKVPVDHRPQFEVRNGRFRNTGTRTFKCHQCQKTFRRSPDLLIHMRIAHVI